MLTLIDKYGAPGTIRTCDRLVRSPSSSDKNQLVTENNYQFLDKKNNNLSGNRVTKPLHPLVPTLPTGWRVLTLHNQPWLCIPPKHQADMSTGAIIDRFYLSCLDTSSIKAPAEYYPLYGCRSQFARSIRRFVSGKYPLGGYHD